MRGIMFNTKYGLEQAVLNRTKTRTWRADKEPRYKIGEVVAIKQCYFDVFNYHVKKNNLYLMKRIHAYYIGKKGWRNKMFTRNEEMPHKIKITKVNPCKLQDVTEEECLREGIVRREIIPFRNIEIAYCFRNSNLYKTAKQAFADLIRKLNGKGYWESNPDGYAYEFELVR